MFVEWIIHFIALSSMLKGVPFRVGHEKIPQGTL